MSRILLVDDEKAVKWAVQEALKDVGYDVETANSGEEGRMKAQEERFDLIVSDLRMPGISGIEMLKDLKKDQPELRAIICSAYGSMESVVEAMRLGVNDFMVKPFKIAVLMKAITDILGPPGEKKEEVGGKSEDAEKEPTDDTKVPTSSIPIGTLPDLLVEPSIFYHVSNEGDESGVISDGVFFDIAEYEGKQVIIFGSAPVIGNTAKLFVPLMRTVFRSQTHHDAEVLSATQSMNEILWKSFHPRPAVSLFYGLLDLESGELCYVCSGESVLGGIRYSDGRDEAFQRGDAQLGLFPGVMLKEERVAYGPGDRLVLVSSARTESLPRLPDVQESFIEELMPEADWLETPVLARQVMERAAQRSESQSASELTVIVVEQPQEVVVESMCQIALQSGEQNLRRLLTELGRLGEEAGANMDEMHDITTAVIEAVNNAQVHAYPNGEGEIDVQMAVSNGEIVIEVRDKGVGFDKDTVNVELNLQDYEVLTRKGGRGIFLMNQLMDRAPIDSEPGRGTIVHMAKRLLKS
ncbi:MAG: response regulator [Planctomycetota bacterium]|nr:response regulator [Planctomycetota bacterium]MDP6502437.1 response regulator [Planctomycetota bacterium]